MKVWVTRESVSCVWCVNIWTGKKRPIKDSGEWNDLLTLLSEEHTTFSFKEKYGFTPRKGSCKQYNLELTEVE